MIEVAFLEFVYTGESYWQINGQIKDYEFTQLRSYMVCKSIIARLHDLGWTIRYSKNYAIAIKYESLNPLPIV